MTVDYNKGGGREEIMCNYIYETIKYLGQLWYKGRTEGLSCLEIFLKTFGLGGVE